MAQLSIDPPLLNTACPWATTEEDLRVLLCCKSIGAVTTRTCMLEGFPHDDAVHRYRFIDSSGGIVAAAETNAASTNSRLVGSVNSLGYSPIPLNEYLDIIFRLSERFSDTINRKPVIISVAGEPSEIARCYSLIFHSAMGVSRPIAMEINLSCPNIPGAPPPAYTFPRLAAYLEALESTPGIAVGIKLPPYTYADQFTSLIETLRPYASKLTFITTTNTLGPCLVFDGDGGDPVGGQVLQGGMAGAPLHPLALGNVKTLRKLLDQTEELRHVMIIGVGGVSDIGGYMRMREAGAMAVGLATGLGTKGIRVFEDIGKHIEGAAQEDVEGCERYSNDIGS